MKQLLRRCSFYFQLCQWVQCGQSRGAIGPYSQAVKWEQFCSFLSCCTQTGQSLGLVSQQPLSHCAPCGEGGAQGGHSCIQLIPEHHLNAEIPI